MLKFSNAKNATAFLWPRDIGEETHGALGDELRAYKKTATWVIAVMLILIAGIVVVERSLTGGHATAWLVGIAGSSILVALTIDRRKGGSDMMLSRTVLNVATAVAF